MEIDDETFNFARYNGRVAERLGSGLQNHVQRFESARDLQGQRGIRSVPDLQIHLFLESFTPILYGRVITGKKL